MRWILLFVALPALSQSDRTCPWLNAATASGIVAGSVSSTLEHVDQKSGDATCEFARQTTPPVTTLRIEVQTMTAPATQFPSLVAKCGPNATPLKAIGNEAVACSKEPNRGQRIEEVIGRVRERAFTILLTTTDQSIAQASLREKGRDVAEQVAGILF